MALGRAKTKKRYSDTPQSEKSVLRRFSGFFAQRAIWGLKIALKLISFREKYLQNRTQRCTLMLK